MPDEIQDDVSNLPEKEADLIRRIRLAAKSKQPAADRVALYTEQANYYLDAAVEELKKTGVAKGHEDTAQHIDDLVKYTQSLRIDSELAKTGTTASSVGTIAKDIIARLGERANADFKAEVAEAQRLGDVAGSEAHKLATELMGHKAADLHTASANLEYPDSARIILMQSALAAKNAAALMPEVRESAIAKQ